MHPHLNMIRPSLQLSRVVDAMWEWDVPVGDVARSIVGKLLPSVAPQLAIHFRGPMWSDRVAGGGHYRQIACGVQTKVVTVRATGPVGAIMVRLKPEAAPLLLGSALQELCDSQVELSDLFQSGDIARLVDQLASAANTAGRVALVEAFLLERVREGSKSAALQAATLQLRSDCMLSVRDLASRVHLSERQLSRRFQAALGIAPKRFARLVRLTRVLSLRQTGSSWADVASHCGFADQAHLIKDFKDLVEHAPEEFFRMAFSAEVREVNSTLGLGTLSNTFIV
jgi:AraC-like DNA-binding protein